MINKTIKFLQHNYIDYVFYTVFLAYCLYTSFSVGYWYDELSWTLKYVHQTTFSEMLYQLTTKIYNLPLYYMALYPFYMISDNTEWLRLPSIMATIGAMYYIQKFVSMYYGKSYKIFVWLLFLFSPVVLFIALRVRPYAFMMFFSAYSFYLYYQRLENFNINNIIKYGIVLTCLAYSHWYGGVLIASYGLSDLYQFFKKKINLKFILSYLICFFMFLPWLILLVVNHKYDFFSYWGHKESYFYIVHVLYCISGLKIICILTLLSFMMIFKQNKSGNVNILPHNLSLFSIFFIWTLTWVYSTINPEGSIIEIRYFFVFIPQWIILFIAFISEINMQNLKQLREKFNQFALLALLICIILFSYAVYYSLSFTAKNLKYDFSGYKELLQLCKKDMNEHKVLLWFYDQKFLNVYDLHNINVVSYMTQDNYDAVFFKRYQNITNYDKYFNSLNKLKNMTCEDGIRYILDDNEIQLYNNYINGKDDTALSTINVCDYDIIYTEYKTLLVPYVKFFLEQYYDISEVKLENENKVDIYKFIRKNQNI